MTCQSVRPVAVNPTGCTCCIIPNKQGIVIPCIGERGHFLGRRIGERGHFLGRPGPLSWAHGPADLFLASPPAPAPAHRLRGEAYEVATNRGAEGGESGSVGW